MLGIEPNDGPVLVTGAAGMVGRKVSRSLEEAGFRVRRHDLPGKLAGRFQDAVEGDLAEEGVCDRIVEGTSCVVHLAAHPQSSGHFLHDLLRPNVISLWRMLQACVTHKIRRVILASTIQVVNGVNRGDYVASVDDVAPTNDYAMTKAWLEVAGGMHHRLHKTDVLCARIGWFMRSRKVLEHYRDTGHREVYLSHDDAGRFFVAAVTGAWTGLRVAYAFSLPRGGRWTIDIGPSRELGFEPQDVFPGGSHWDEQGNSL